MADSTTVAYLAGFFDGEGSVTSMKFQGGSVGLRTQMSQLRRAPLELAVATFSGGRIGERSESAILNALWHGQAASNMLEQMLPFLLVKREQALLGIEFGQVMRKKLASGQYTFEDRARLFAIRDELREANQKRE